MIIVSVFREEAMAVGGHPHEYDPFEGVEIFGVFPDADGPRMAEKLGAITAVHPNWKFEIDAGPHQSSLDEAVRIAISYTH